MVKTKEEKAQDKALRRERQLQKESERGLVYIGHLPHGFYEEEIKKYFQQFGPVTNVKVGRSRKTGNSKGFGYVEFKNQEVAKIAAETMNNYIMFKKRLVAEYVQERPKHIFHGKQSTKISYTAGKRQLQNAATKNKVIDEKTHIKKCKRKLKSLKEKSEKLKKLGIDCGFITRTTVDVPKELKIKTVKKY